jgi:microcystin-dependent protein
LDVYLGMIILFAGNFAPRGFLPCQGQLLSISTYSALFSLLGTSYGGNGVQTFGLPDLQGRVPIGTGSGVGLSTYVLGQKGGLEQVTLNVNNLPPHGHALNGYQQYGNKDLPGTTHVLAGGTTSASPTTPVSLYSTNAPNTTLAPASIGSTGNGQPTPIMQPFLALTYCIAIAGIYPSRN